MRYAPFQIVLTFAVVALLAGIASTDVDASSTLDSVITYPDGKYDIGSEVAVTVHVFEFGQYRDVEAVDLEIGEAGRRVGTVRVGTGLYEGSFEIQEEDLGSLNVVEVSADVKDDGVWIEHLGHVTVRTVISEAFTADIVLTDFTDNWVRPGDTVGYDVFFTFQGTPVDPDPGNVSVTLHGSTWDCSGIEYSETGHYVGHFSVPDGLVESQVVYLTLSYSYTSGNITYSANMYNYIHLEMMRVWCEVIRGNKNGFEFNLHVHGLDGGAIEGAYVDFHYYLDTLADGVREHVSESLDGLTDDQGTATFEIEYESIDPERPWIDISGNAYHADLSQEFDETIWILDRKPNPEYLYIGDDRIVVDCLNPLPLPLDSDVTLVLELNDDAGPMSNMTVGYSVSTVHEVVTPGTTSTDGDGHMRIPVHTPEKDSISELGITLDLRITLEVGGEIGLVEDTYPCWNELGPFQEELDEGLSLEVHQNSSRGELQVRVADPLSDGSDEKAYFVWGVGSVDWGVDLTFHRRNWTKVSSSSMFGGMDLVAGERSGGSFAANISVPAFVPDGSKLFVVGVIETREDGGVVWKLNYVEDVPFERKTNDEDGTHGSSNPFWTGWIAVAILLIISLVVLLHRRSNSDEPARPLEIGQDEGLER